MATCINCTNNDPCFCIGTTTPVTPSCPKGVECCLVACGDTIDCNDAVGPCGAVGAYDLSGLSHNTSGCKGSISFILEYWDEAFFEDVSLTTSGVLTWTTLDESTVDKFSVIKFRIQCNSKDECGDFVVTLTSVASINVCVKNLCTGQICSVDGEACNPCNGLCEPEVPDVEIT